MPPSLRVPLVDDLLASQRMHLEQREVVQGAMRVCRSSKAGFVDALIAQVAKTAGCGQTASFDKVAVRFAGMEIAASTLCETIAFGSQFKCQTSC
jgi:predicted nucleic-acid-binding protein